MPITCAIQSTLVCGSQTPENYHVKLRGSAGLVSRMVMGPINDELGNIGREVVVA
jgi:hypothetical protein